MRGVSHPLTNSNQTSYRYTAKHFELNSRWGLGPWTSGGAGSYSIFTNFSLCLAMMVNIWIFTKMYLVIETVFYYN